MATLISPGVQASENEGSFVSSQPSVVGAASLLGLTTHVFSARDHLVQGLL